MYFIIGLGNPGKKYEKTRHNIGFAAINNYQTINNFSDWKNTKKFQAEISEGTINDQATILVKPQAFMNNSGKTVKLLAASYKLRVASLIVIHDDIDLPLGKIKIVKDRGSAGHKGIESIIQNLKTEDFIRLRIGIQPKTGKPKNVEKFVLQKFDKDEENILKYIFEKAVEAIGTIIKEGLEKAMSEYN